MGFLGKTLKNLRHKAKKGEKDDKEASLVDVAKKEDLKHENKESTKSRNQEVEKEKVQESKEEAKVENKKETKKEPVKKEEKKKEIKEDTKNAYKVLIKPLVSEKAAEAGKLNQYIFVVSVKANKQEIKKAIKAVYGIKPIKVNVINMRGKKVRFGRVYGKRKDFKKAIVTLPKGKSIQIYEGT